MSWTLIDHTGDVGIDVVAPTREAMFAEAARAMFSILADLPAEPAGKEEILALPEGDVAEGLRDFLGELLFRFSEGRRMYVGFEPLCGAVEARWEPYDAVRHPLRTELKAVTWHQLAAADSGGRWKARVIFDV